MKALVIDAENQTIEPAEINTESEIQSIIGFATVISDPIDNQGDRLYFDEECFLRGSGGRFQLDTLVPVSGKAVIAGSDASGNLADVVIEQQDLAQRVKYL